MNFEYKVGYLWKSHEEDPGQRSSFGGCFDRTARTEYPIRPSGLCDATADRAPCFQAAGDVLSPFLDVGSCIGSGSACRLTNFLSFLSFSFSLLPFSLPLLFLPVCLLDLAIWRC